MALPDLSFFVGTRSLARTARFSLLLVLPLGATACPGDDAPVTTETESTTTTTSDTTTTTTPEPSESSESSSSSESSGADTTAGSSSTGPVDTCGNGSIDADEVCDGEALGDEDCLSQGFDAGALACAADCMGYDTSGCTSFACGNDIAEAEAKEVCDGTDFAGSTCQSLGFDTGVLTCALDCGSIDTSGCGTCGNVVVDGDEVCDGIVLLGQTCASQGFSSGTLGCTPDCLAYDVSQCIMCGNDVIDGVEPCDGVDLGGATCQSEGFADGIATCADDCSALDLSSCYDCGDGIVSGPEACDVADPSPLACADIGLGGTAVGCAPDCSALDLAACDDPTGYGDCINFDPALVCTPEEECVTDGAVPPNGVCMEFDCANVGECPPALPTGNAPVTCQDVTGDAIDDCWLDCQLGQTCPDGMFCFAGFICLWDPS